jgi:hypothetical protein
MESMWISLVAIHRGDPASSGIHQLVRIQMVVSEPVPVYSRLIGLRGEGEERVGLPSHEAIPRAILGY